MSARTSARGARPLAAVLALGVLLSACAPRRADPPPRPPDLVLISLDTLRADLLELRREDGSPELPTLRALADEAISFPNAWAPQPFTLPSHMTMLTGLHPLTHGVDGPGKRLAQSVPTLPQLLRRAGYATAGVTCISWLGKGFGFARGFEQYRNLDLGLTFAPRVRARAVGLAARMPPGRPRFLFAHFYDAHGDWEGEGNRLSYFSPPELRTGLEVDERALCAPGGPCAIRFVMSRDGLADLPTPDFAQTHFELYRRGARALDAELRLFFDELRRLGLWGDAVVVVTADHGEEFGEHGGWVHAQVYRETLRVPLLVKLPRGERGGERVARPVALEDIAPTLLLRAGLPVAPGMIGFDLLVTPRSSSPRPLVARQSRHSTRFGLRLADRLLVWNPRWNERRLFDLAADPLERAEIPGAPGEVARLEERLEGALRRLRADGRTATTDGRPLDDTEVAALKALGYLQ